MKAQGLDVGSPAAGNTTAKVEEGKARPTEDGRCDVRVKAVGDNDCNKTTTNNSSCAGLLCILRRATVGPTRGMHHRVLIEGAYSYSWRQCASKYVPYSTRSSKGRGRADTAHHSSSIEGKAVRIADVPVLTGCSTATLRACSSIEVCTGVGGNKDGGSML